ncbi:MAG TPA: aminotransferase class I/II-fold pyridoxal phosphate-dependent enzyme, partial [Lachnospiraceae bacterium]|nr:aminotransferase class I/II-fold pyridoxal phosphate-dependent enzyme [Lachnospiraceae bacterium]
AGGLLFLCNPNNPIGNVIEKDLMLRIVKKAEERNLYVVIDECFLPFLPEYASVSFRSAYQNHKNACVINAFTKLYAMPGLRLGFVLSADRELLTKLKEQLPAWNVSAVAQAAGTAALLDPAYLEKTYQWITAERSYVGENLLLCKPRIKKVYCPAANFVFFEADDMLKDHLLQRQIAVRSCGNFRGLKCGDYRAAIRSHAENKYLIEAIREEAHKWHEI